MSPSSSAIVVCTDSPTTPHHASTRGKNKTDGLARCASRNVLTHASSNERQVESDSNAGKSNACTGYFSSSLRIAGHRWVVWLDPTAPVTSSRAKCGGGRAYGLLPNRLDSVAAAAAVVAAAAAVLPPPPRR